MVMAMVLQKFEIELAAPVGYKIIGYRTPKKGEMYLANPSSNDTQIVVACHDFATRFMFIVEKIVEYRTPLMPQDFEKAIEVRDHEGEEWEKDTLRGYRVNDANYRFVGDQSSWKQGRIQVEA